MRKFLAKIVLFAIFINSVFSTGLINIFANPKIESTLGLKWNKESSLTDNLEIVTREEKNEDAFLSWDIGKTSSENVQQGVYKLSYYDNDGKKVELEVKKDNDKATVTYKLNDDNKVNGNKKLQVYKPEDKIYKEATKTNFPPNDDSFKIANFWENGKAKSVSFIIKKGTGFAFKYQGKNVKFKWDNADKFYFATNGISKGYVYDFNLDFTKNLQTKPPTQPTNKQNISIFTGIKSTTFKATPYANNGKGEQDNPITQIERPIKEYPGQEPEIHISFETPKRLNQTNHQYEYITSNDTTTQNNYTESIKVILDLKSLNKEQEMQIIIPNIYEIPLDNGIAAKNKTIEDEINKNLTGAEVYELKRSSNGETVSFKIRNKPQAPETPGQKQKITPGSIYNPVTISATSNKKTDEKGYFEALSTVLPIGSVYTYIEYQIISLGSKEFYIEFQPFKEYNGFYTIYQGSSILTKWADYEEKNKGAQKVMIPVPLELIEDTTSESLFRIDFQFAPSNDTTQDNLTLQSQVLKYKGHKSDIKLGVPENLKVVESDIIRETSNDKTQDQLYVTFKWDVGYEDVLKALYENNESKEFPIKYRFYETLKQNGEDEKEFAAVDFNVKFNGNKSEFTVTDSMTKTQGYGGVKFIKGETKERTEIISGKEVKKIEAYAELKIPVSDKNSQEKLRLIYPNIYFITTEGEYEIGTDSSKKTYKTGKSLQATLTLDGLLNIELTPPQNLKIQDNSITNQGFLINMDKLGYEVSDDVLYNYVNRLLKRYGLQLSENGIKYNVYITQDKNLLDEMRKHDSREINKEQNFPQDLKDKVVIKDINQNISLDSPINAKQNAIVDELRKGNVVKLTNLIQNNQSIQNIKFEGLDENQAYYIMAETVADLTDLPSETKTGKKDISKYSKIVTATTLKDNELPEDTEKVPSAPTNFYSKDTTLNSTHLIWDAVTEVSEPRKNSNLEYQFIKVRGQALSDSFLKTKNSYEKTWQDLEKIQNKQGFKTSGNKVLEYKQNSFVETTQDRYDYQNYNGAQRDILDKTLTPNQIYFYYIRTVRVIDGQDKAYSVWVPLSVTTKNVDGPKNLKVERNAEYNKKTEVVISFDAPKISKDIIGTEYNFQYSIKNDNGEWSKDIDMPKDELKIEDTQDEKTMKVTYKIKGLKSGSFYTIRVRLFNIPLKSASMYSNEVDHRTDGAPNDNDYEEDINDWNDNFKELIEKLKKQPYWFMQDTVDVTSVVFRPQYFDTILQQNNTSIINLPEGIGGNYKEYYIPANAILKSFEQNKGFKLTFNQTDVIFNAKSISPTENDAIKELEKRKTSESIADYFVKITAYFKPVQYLIEGIKNTSPIVEIKLDVIATKETTIKWDEYSVDHIDNLLKTTKYSTDIKESIKKMLDDKKDELFISKQINKYVEQFKTDFGRKILEEVKNITKRTFYSYKLNGNIIIAYPSLEGLITKGYKLSLGNWTNISVSDYAGKKAIFTKEFGEFTFTQTKLIVNGIENIPNGAIINNIIIKYGLDDYFGKNGNINLKANLTKDMAIGSLARIAGNSKTKNPIEFFKSKGIVLSQRNGNNNISTQETIYITMKIYEIKTNKKLDTIKIRNYNRLANVKGINSKYKKALDTAFELGIYTNENINPNGTITIQEFLQMLGNLSSKIGI